MAVIVVTGASGYVGSHITHQLVQQGYKVRAMVRSRAKAEQEGRLQDIPVEVVEGDVNDLTSLHRAFDSADAIIHTVAIAIEKGDLTYEKINYEGTVNVVDIAKSLGIQRLVNLSQLGADSKLPYRFLASKGRAQEYVASSGLDWTAFRPSVIWGPEDEFANTFARLVPITPIIFPIVGDENSKFQPVWVDDVAVSIVKSISMPETIGKEYELGGPEVLSLEEIERRTLEAMDRKRKMIHFPLGLIKSVVSAMEFVLPAPPVTRSLLELLQVSNVTTNNAIALFVPEPRSFTAENIAPYMRKFQVRETISQFLGK